MPVAGPEKKGSFFLIGGSADICLLRLVRLAGGSRGHIVILPHASATPLRSAHLLQEQLVTTGRTSLIMPRSEKTIPDDATAVYFAGGDQSRLVKLLNPAIRRQLSGFLRSGGLVAGSSAGAAAVVTTMIADGMNDGVLSAGSLRLRPGLGLLPGAVIDTHFRQRGRFSRLMAAVSLLPATLGVGLDEDTAVEIAANGSATVHGKGHGWFFTPGQEHDSDLNQARGLRASVVNVSVSALSSGQVFDLKSRSWVRSAFRPARSDRRD